MVSQIQVPLVLRKREVAKLIGISIPTLDRLRAAGDFVKPIWLGKQAIGFLRADVEGWISSRSYKTHFAYCADVSSWA